MTKKEIMKYIDTMIQRGKDSKEACILQNAKYYQGYIDSLTVLKNTIERRGIK